MSWGTVSLKRDTESLALKMKMLAFVVIISVIGMKRREFKYFWEI